MHKISIKRAGGHKLIKLFDVLSNDAMQKAKKRSYNF